MRNLPINQYKLRLQKKNYLELKETSILYYVNKAPTYPSCFDSSIIIKVWWIKGPKSVSRADVPRKKFILITLSLWYNEWANSI